MSKLLLTIGEKFVDHAEMVDNPHILEGCMYECDGGGVVMFCQIAFSTFAFINLMDGNRYNDGIQWRASNHPELGGCNARGVLRMMHREMDDGLTYIGTLPSIYKGEAV